MKFFLALASVLLLPILGCGQSVTSSFASGVNVGTSAYPSTGAPNCTSYGDATWANPNNIVNPPPGTGEEATIEAAANTCASGSWTAILAQLQGVTNSVSIPSSASITSVAFSYLRWTNETVGSGMTEAMYTQQVQCVSSGNPSQTIAIPGSDVAWPTQADASIETLTYSLAGAGWTGAQASGTWTCTFYPEYEWSSVGNGNESTASNRVVGWSLAINYTLNGKIYHTVVGPS